METNKTDIYMAREIELEFVRHIYERIDAIGEQLRSTHDLLTAIHGLFYPLVTAVELEFHDIWSRVFHHICDLSFQWCRVNRSTLPQDIPSALESVHQLIIPPTANNVEEAWAACIIGWLAESGLLSEEDGNDSTDFWLEKCLAKAQGYALRMKAYEILGSSHQRLGHALDAVNCFRKHIECVPDGEANLWAMALYRLSRALIDVPCFEESTYLCECLESAVTNNDDDDVGNNNSFMRGLSLTLRSTINCSVGYYAEVEQLSREAIEVLEPIIRNIKVLVACCDEQLFSILCIEQCYRCIQLVAEAKKNWKQVFEAIVDLQDFKAKFNIPTDKLEAIYDNLKITLAERKSNVISIAEQLVQGYLDSRDWFKACLSMRWIARLAFQCALDMGDPLVQMMESHYKEAESLAERNKDAIILRALLSEHGQCLEESGMYKQAIEKLDFSLKMFMKMELSNFASFNEGRICYVEASKDAFRSIQHAIYQDGNEPWRGLVWAERERARDLFYQISRANVDDGTVAAVPCDDDFDQDDEKAFKEICSIHAAVDDGTVFLVFSQVSPSQMITYLVYKDEQGLTSVASQSIGKLKPPMHASQSPSHNPSVSDLLKKVVSAGSGRVASALPIFTGLKEQLMLVLKGKLGDATEFFGRLYKLLILPWSKYLETAKMIVIVPTEELSVLSFAALYDEDNELMDPYLIQKYELVCAPSLRLFHYCQCHSQSLPSIERTALVVGNPRNNLEPLEHAEDEARFVSETLESKSFKPIVLLGEAATKEAILKLLPSCDWFHITSHGSAGTLYTSITENIKITHQEEQDILCFPTKMVDGKITGPDIRRNKMKASCMVLSACATGKGQVCSEGVLGLPRDLHMVGVPALVVSLWEVNDEATHELVRELYNNLQKHHLSRALQLAMIKMIEVYEYPLYWAGFIISGTPYITLTC